MSTTRARLRALEDQVRERVHGLTQRVELASYIVHMTTSTYPEADPMQQVELFCNSMGWEVAPIIEALTQAEGSDNAPPEADS